MKEVITFLSKLKKNNSREWMEKNKAAYEAAKDRVLELVERTIGQIQQFDPAIKGQEAKNCLFRIHRDIRFSADKKPYKTNFGASISPAGKKSVVPGYYIHIEPGGSFVGGGIYVPPAPELHAVRQEIEYHFDEFNKIISSRNFKEFYPKLEDFDKLKKTPKGFEVDSPASEYLKHKSIIAMHPIPEKILIGKDLEKYLSKACKALYPMNVFLRRALD